MPESPDIRYSRGAPPSPPTPFNEENRRLREEDKTVWSRAKTFWRRNFTPGGKSSGQTTHATSVRTTQAGSVGLQWRGD